ncbi:hypothetical protein BDR06DRAFT_964396 [Suillus hirtellus]|nr:hypothetical protein BDR06DRAFT_964396 [Suillus hirtellus]
MVNVTDADRIIVDSEDEDALRSLQIADRSGLTPFYTGPEKILQCQAFTMTFPSSSNALKSPRVSPRPITFSRILATLKDSPRLARPC